MPRKRLTRPPSANAPVDSPASLDPVDPREGWLAVAVAILLTMRFFLPAESADQGETLWIVLLTLLTGAAFLLDVLRNGWPLGKPDLLDAGLGLLVGGHVIAALGVIATEGQKRAALNMLWEWIGFACAALLIRAVVHSRKGREILMSTVILSGVVLAGLGIWQHYYWYPQIASRFVELEELQNRDPADVTDVAAHNRRLEALRRELGWTPDVDGGAGKMFRDRVQASTEPIGRFALANTFAGLLLASWFLTGGALRPTFFGWGRSSLMQAGALLFGLVLIGYCLWLTKSRTAWVGMMVGAAICGLLLQKRMFAGTWARLALAGMGVFLVGMPLAAAVTGSLDWQVLSEAPKSLQYRLEYWTSTWGVIRDHWVLGVGPGNFRQHYMQYKLAGASEEVLDPHNQFLDVWANGGLLALLGLVSILLLVAKAAWLALRDRGPQPADAGSSIAAGRPVVMGIVGTAAIALATVIEMLNGGGVGAQWLMLGCGWWTATAVMARPKALAVAGPAVLGAFAGLVTHLAGAGGIGMPAVLQLFWLLAAVIDCPPQFDEKPQTSADRPRTSMGDRRVVLAMLFLAAAAALGSVWTAILPVTKSRAAINIGRAVWQIDQRPREAERWFRQAALDDALSPEPWRELAALHFARWQSSNVEADFDAAVAAQEAALARDPLNPNQWSLLGQLWMRRYESELDARFARQAVPAFEQAVNRYPNQATAQASLALAAHVAGESSVAQSAAARALQLDDSNRQRGHVDKFLPEDDRLKLLEIAKSLTAEEPNAP